MARMARRRPGFASFGLPSLVVGPLLVAGFVSGCTPGESDASPSTVPRIGATNYVTQPIVTLPPTTQPGDSTPAGEPEQPEQQYRVRRGDTVSGIAQEYEITAQQLASYNGWENGPSQLILPGQTIRIPPFAVLPSEDDPADSTPATLYVEGALCPDGSRQDTYEVQRGDYLGRVAEELDVEIGELEAANEFTVGFEIFYPGLDILVPCADEDLGTPVEPVEATATSES